jgi:hypothetical protein
MSASAASSNATPGSSTSLVLQGDKPFEDPYKQPVKRIKTHDDLAIFQKSNTMKVYLSFLEKCSTAITDKKVSDVVPSSAVRSPFLFRKFCPSMTHFDNIYYCQYHRN